MPDPFPITEAQITGIFFEAIFYGFHLVSAGYCAYVLIGSKNWGRKSQINWPMLLVSFALLAVGTFDVMLGYAHELKAFVFYTGPGGAAEELTNISDWINISRTATVVINTMIGDSMLIYRCWVIYNRSFKVVALSAFLWLGCLATAIWILLIEFTLQSNVLITGSKKLSAILTAFWALTISVNILTTFLMVWKLWKADRDNREFAYTKSQRRWSGYQSKLQEVMRIVVESGLFYTATAFVSFVLVLVGDNGVYVITDIECQVVGIAFNMIFIRASNLANRVENNTVMSNQSLPLHVRSPPMFTSTGEGKVGVHVLTTHISDGGESIRGDSRSEIK